MSSGPIRVLIADDDPLAREAIRLHLEQSHIVVVGMAGNGLEAVRMVQELEPDVALLDVDMPGMDGLDALSALKSARPDTRAVILTAHGKSSFVARAMASGAAAYLTKSDVDLEKMPETISAVVEGEIAIVGQDLLRRAIEEPPVIQNGGHSENGTVIASLTTQERLVLELIAQGLSNDQIADTLVVSYNTVKTHTSRVFSKLGVSDRTQAAIIALRSGLVD